MARPWTGEKEIAAVGRVRDPAERAVKAGELLAALSAAQVEVKSLRQSAVQELVESGYTFQEIADLLGVNRSRVFQISKGQSGDLQKYYEA